MANHLYKIECLTNLHVGSGDVNYNIIDNEVEKDAVTGYPIIHSSGIKGALREHASKNQFKGNESAEVAIFGQKSGKGDVAPGTYKFFDANIISRPMRVINGEIASIPVIAIDAINDFLHKITALGCNIYDIEKIDTPDFKGNRFLSNVSGINVEGESTGDVPQKIAQQLANLKDIIGEKYAIAARINDYDLPVVARNQLDNGESKNLWYEEVVPHGSVFYTLIITPEKDTLAEKDTLDLSDIIQIGGHATIGYGFTRFTELKKDGVIDEQKKSK